MHNFGVPYPPHGGSSFSKCCVGGRREVRLMLLRHELLNPGCARFSQKCLAGEGGRKIYSGVCGTDLIFSEGKKFRAFPLSLKS